jgi:hypothetical protein
LIIVRNGFIGALNRQYIGPKSTTQFVVNFVASSGMLL